MAETGEVSLELLFQRKVGCQLAELTTTCLRGYSQVGTGCVLTEEKQTEASIIQWTVGVVGCSLALSILMLLLFYYSFRWRKIEAIQKVRGYKVLSLQSG